MRPLEVVDVTTRSSSTVQRALAGYADAVEAPTEEDRWARRGCELFVTEPSVHDWA
jgi:hypothetical protein